VLWAPTVAGVDNPIAIVLFYVGALGPAASALIVTRAIGAPLGP
jgi:hypothetical protein